MDWFTGSVLYVLIWWTVLFAVLPFGTRPVNEADARTGWRGVPDRPLMWRKVIATTLVATLVWAGAYAVISDSDLLSFRHGILAMPDH
jgi:predicted secreted protein